MTGLVRQIMCEKSNEINQKIAPLRTLSRAMADELILDRIAAMVEGYEAHKSDYNPSRKGEAVSVGSVGTISKHGY